ncbi:MAG: hypothetical protein A2539_08650 [Elusimicrobia bacterium RIFOXYD2_FULL_34_15]|nr:MAG: hypothetical protein A2539_08650 [Elusimicrobia bacterium RIFOXYD2_FULL_34_15]
MENKDPLTERIISCCFKVHTELGAGFNENIYHNALKLMFTQEHIKYDTEKRYDVSYHGKRIGNLIVDLVVEDKVIVEIKAITGNIPEVFKYQVLSYLKVSAIKVGLLINFGNKSCQVKRIMF